MSEADEHQLDVLNMVGHALQNSRDADDAVKRVVPKQAYYHLLLIAQYHKRQEERGGFDLAKVQAAINEWRLANQEVHELKAFLGEQSAQQAEELVSEAAESVKAQRQCDAQPVPPVLLREASDIVSAVSTPQTQSAVKGFLSDMEKKHRGEKGVTSVAEAMVTVKDKLEAAIAESQRQSVDCSEAVAALIRVLALTAHDSAGKSQTSPCSWCLCT